MGETGLTPGTFREQYLTALAGAALRPDVTPLLRWLPACRKQTDIHGFAHHFQGLRTFSCQPISTEGPPLWSNSCIFLMRKWRQRDCDLPEVHMSQSRPGAGLCPKARPQAPCCCPLLNMCPSPAAVPKILPPDRVTSMPFSSHPAITCFQDVSLS